MTDEHGRLKKSAPLIAVSMVNTQSGDSLYLNVTRQEMGRQGWSSLCFPDLGILQRASLHSGVFGIPGGSECRPEVVPEY
jgi:hypothetical protein